MSLLAATPLACASEALFETGRFVSGDREVFSGLFLDDVTIDSVTIGSATYRASMEELIEPLTVRVRVDERGDGNFTLLTDEMLRSGDHPVTFAVAMGLKLEDYSTALEAMQGLSLAHMLFTDGSATVQIDVLLIASLYDDRPAENDASPEVIVLGSILEHAVSAAAIIGGNVDEPILARDPVPFSADAFRNATTGVEMVMHQSARPNPIAMVGFDLSHDLGVEEGVRALGYRITIAPGKPAMFNVLGAGAESQRALAQDIPIVPNIEDFLLGDFGAAATSGGGSGVFRVPGLSEVSQFLARVPLDFQGSGGGGGGGTNGTTPPPPVDPPDDPVIPAPATLPALALLLIAPRRSRRA